jgi:hypothetical protein
MDFKYISNHILKFLNNCTLLNKNSGWVWFGESPCTLIVYGVGTYSELERDRCTVVLKGNGSRA